MGYTATRKIEVSISCHYPVFNGSEIIFSKNSEVEFLNIKHPLFSYKNLSNFGEFEVAMNPIILRELAQEYISQYAKNGKDIDTFYPEHSFMEGIIWKGYSRGSYDKTFPISISGVLHTEFGEYEIEGMLISKNVDKVVDFFNIMELEESDEFSHNFVEEIYSL